MDTCIGSRALALTLFSLVLTSGLHPDRVCAAPTPWTQDGDAIPEAPLSADTLSELRSIRGGLERDPIIVPLILIAHTGTLYSPWSIVVLRDALQSRRRWILALTLGELARRNALDLVQFGGAPLVERLIQLTEHGRAAVKEPARAVLEKIHRRLPHLLQRDRRGVWDFDTATFPAGRELPKGSEPGLEGAPPRKGGTVVKKPSAETLYGGRLLGAESATRGFDLVWAIDCTGSMTRQLPGVLEGATRVSGVLSALLGDVNLGLIAYRDRVEARRVLKPDLRAIVRDLTALRADKGGSPSERVDVAFAKARQSRMGWRRGSACAMVFIGDAGPAARQARDLYEAVRRARARWTTLRIDCVKVLGGFEVPLAAKNFWAELAAAGGGRVASAPPGIDLAESLCNSAWPSLDPQLLRRILQVIWTTEGWIELPGAGGRRVEPEVTGPSRGSEAGASASSGKTG